MLELERYIDFLAKHKLTQEQFLLLYCLYYKRFDIIQKYKTMYDIPKETMIGKFLFDDLVDKGFIEVKIIENNVGMASQYTVTSKFTDIFIDKYEAGYEFWDLYPAYQKSEGKVYPLTLWDEDEFREIYWNKIKGLKEEHAEVIKDLKYAVEKGMIKGKIETFVRSRQWIPIRKIRVGDKIKITEKDESSFN